jgi:hypothetical protein
MGLLKNLLVKEHKFCVLWGTTQNGEEEKLDEFVAVDLGTSVIVCDMATKLKCWEVPKVFVNRFLKQMFEEYEKVELTCY